MMRSLFLYLPFLFTLNDANYKCISKIHGVRSHHGQQPARDHHGATSNKTAIVKPNMVLTMVNCYLLLLKF